MSGLAIEILKMNFMLQDPFETKNITPSMVLLLHGAFRKQGKRQSMSHEKTKIAQMFESFDLKQLKNIKCLVEICVL